MKVYEGTRTSLGCEVTVNGAPLSPRYDLRCHSPTGYEWAYQGSGPAQLALAILADCLGDDEAALDHYQDFKRQVIATLPLGRWKMTTEHVMEWYRPRLGACAAGATP